MKSLEVFHRDSHGGTLVVSDIETKLFMFEYQAIKVKTPFNDTMRKALRVGVRKVPDQEYVPANFFVFDGYILGIGLERQELEDTPKIQTASSRAFNMAANLLYNLKVFPISGKEQLAKHMFNLIDDRVEIEFVNGKQISANEETTDDES